MNLGGLVLDGPKAPGRAAGERVFEIMDAEEEAGIDEDEEIIQQCIEVIRSEQKASVSLLQRRLRLVARGFH